MIRKKQVKIYKLNSRNEMRALTINGGLVCFYTVDRLDNNKPHIIMADNNNVNELIRRGEAYV